MLNLVYLSARDGELLLALLALSSLIIFQPGMALTGETHKSFRQVVLQIL